MNIDLAALPDDVATLQGMVRTLAAERTNLTVSRVPAAPTPGIAALFLASTCLISMLFASAPAD
jgi:hypothetical protein